MGSRNQADVRVDHKNKILKSFFELIESHKHILQILLVFESRISELISKAFLLQTISSPKVIASADLY